MAIIGRSSGSPPLAKREFRWTSGMDDAMEGVGQNERKIRCLELGRAFILCESLATASSPYGRRDCGTSAPLIGTLSESIA